MPNHPNYELAVLSNSICDSLNTGIETNLLHHEGTVVLFPNPAHELLNCRVPFTEENYTFKIYNSLLQEYALKTKRSASGEYFQIFISDLTPGVYFVEVIANEFRLTRKFIKE